MKNKKLKVCILGSTYPRFNEDPQVPWLRHTVKMLKERGNDVTVVASAFSGGESHKIDGVDVLRFRYAPRNLEKLTHDEGAPSKINGPLGKLLAALYILSGIVHMLYWSKKYNFDVINVHWPLPHGLFTILPKFIFGTKVVVTAHGAGMAMARKSSLVNLLLKFSMLYSDSVMTNSSHTRSELKNLTGEDSTVIPYGATVEFKPGDAPFSGNKRVKILFSGRHIQRKGVDYLIRAMTEILAQKDAELIITGTGDRTKEWTELASSLKLQDKIKFLGFVTNSELAECYRSCDVYCLPAIFDDNDDTEGLGVVLIEALLYARPVVATRVGGIVDVIKHNETGVLVEEKSPYQLAKALLWMIDNPLQARKLGLNGQELVSEVFDWNKIIQKIDAELKSVLDTKEIASKIENRAPVSMEAAA